MLAHQLEPEMARIRSGWIEAAAIIGYQQQQLGRMDLEHQVNVCCPRVFGNILQRLPNNPDQRRLAGERNLRFIVECQANLTSDSCLEARCQADQRSRESSPELI
jgi:hypothetical protein